MADDKFMTKIIQLLRCYALFHKRRYEVEGASCQVARFPHPFKVSRRVNDDISVRHIDLKVKVQPMSNCNGRRSYFASINKGFDTLFKSFTCFLSIKRINITCNFKAVTIISLNNI